MLAVEENHIDCVNLLLTYEDIDVNSTDYCGDSALNLASYLGYVYSLRSK